MKQGLVVGCMFVSCSVLAPIMWQMWIILGTANSNFYFGVTLAYNAAQVNSQNCKHLCYAYALFLIFRYSC